MTLCLTQTEVADLTRKQKYSAQARELDFMGIPYTARRDGSLAVLRIHVEVMQSRQPAEPELHFE